MTLGAGGSDKPPYISLIHGGKSREARDILGLLFKHVAITCVGLGGGIFKGIFAALGGSKKLGFCIMSIHTCGKCKAHRVM